jgi:hypothetical protein
VIAALDGEGRWITRSHGSEKSKGREFADRIETATFIVNLDLLTDYLQAGR